MEIEKYLENKKLGYENLSESERKAISSFTLIWSLFESQLLNENASANVILDKCQEWEANYGINSEIVDEHLQYFRARYITDGETNNRYNHLHIRRNDHEELINAVLLGNRNDPASKLSCCLIIIYRFRNNFFHGLKWAYEFKDQQENFERSCALLAWCVDSYNQ